MVWMLVIHKSPKSNMLLKEGAIWMGFPDLSLISECPMRWNSFLTSGKRFLDLRYPMTSTLDQVNSDLQLLPKDWDLLKALCEEMEVFQEVTNLVSGNTYFTMNYVL